MQTLAAEIIQGRRLTRLDDLTPLLQAGLEDLCAGADQIRKALRGAGYELCTIINARSGRCGEDCTFCAQSCHHQTQAQEYPFLEVEEIVRQGKRDEAAGVQRYSLVTAGRAVTGPELDQALAAYRRLREETGLGLCASFGFQSVEDFRRLKEAGVTRYHANLETSRRNFPNICTTHSYQDKIDNIRRAKQAGLQICSGGIVGLGETWEDRLELALDLAELEVDSIPLNLLTPIPGTPLEGTPPLSVEEVRRIVAVFRYINPTAWIRMAAGRGRFADGGAILFRSGANSAITGDMLTTTGTNIAQDLDLMKQGGFLNGNQA
ncbi:MAG: biotin synthase BioB [Oscillospiraceae bacterium]|jgi:biotin synthase|nr:biotin synthase BioB [Oscillospiraceae bacterium]MCI9581925.1 biotin synthase BioB [Oscillospiraceae bacterium]